MARPFDFVRFTSWIETLERRASSAVVILEAGDEVLLVKANYKPHWSFPGGVVDKNETPKQAAVRELKEETNIDVSPGDLQFGWVVTRASQAATTYQFIFRAQLKSEMVQDIKLQASEIEDYRIVSRQDILSKDLHYGKAIEAWANNFSDGYLEQTFGESPD